MQLGYFLNLESGAGALADSAARVPSRSTGEEDFESPLSRLRRLWLGLAVSAEEIDQLATLPLRETLDRLQ